MRKASKILSIVLLALLIVAPQKASAEPLRGVFTEYSSIDGLAHNNIHDIHTDSRGFVWLCTWSGVSRFDGYHFKNYCTDPKNMPVRHNRFRAVDEDRKGNLWFRTYDDHIYRFNRQSEEFEEVCKHIEGLHEKAHRAGKLLCCKHSEMVWIEYQGFGVVGFGTSDDGQLLTYNHIGNPLMDASVELMHEDAQGNVWIVGNGGNIVRSVQAGDLTLAATTEEEVRAITEVDGGVVFATDHMLWFFDKTDGTLARTEAFERDCITQLATAHDRESIYIGTLRSGLYSLTPQGSLTHHRRGSMPTRVRNLTVDSHGTVWITDTREGITRFAPEKGSYKHFTQQRNTVKYYSDTTSMVIESGDRVWIKMNHVGFGYYDRTTDTVEPFYNSPAKADCRMTNGVATFEVDKEGVLWLSTYYERGLQRIVLQKSERTTLPLGNSTAKSNYSDEVRALECDREGNTWVGTKEGHLYCYAPGHTLLHHYHTLPWGSKMGPIYTIKQDSKGDIWVGTKGDGIYKLTPRSNGKGHSMSHLRHNDDDRYSLSNDQVYCIEEDDKGRIWVATYGGAINMLPTSNSTKFYNTINSFPHYPIEVGDKARYIVADGPERILLATSEGLIVFNPNEGPDKIRFIMSQRSQENEKGLKANDIIHILKTSSGDVWLSTYGGGLSRIESYNEDGVPQFETFTASDGLPSNIVLAATESEGGILWLSTEKGIAKFEPKERIFTSYTRYDGFKPTLYNEAAAITTSEGNVLFGGVDNLHVLHPQEAAVENYDYRLRFTSLEMQNQEAAIGRQAPLSSSISEGGQVELPYNYLLFKVEFASLNFRLQNRVGYIYKLDGYDSEWTDSHEINSAYYSKVPPGRYTFRVKAYVGNPLMAGEEIALHIRIVTPPWQSWWAWCIYIALAVGLLWLIGHIYLRMAKLRTNARVEQDTAEMKLKFFTNISHELRTPLTLIMGGIEDVQKYENLSPRAENSLNLSYKNSKRMLSLINQILDFRKVVKNKMELRVERLDIVEVAKGVAEDFRDITDERKMQLIFSYSRDSIHIWGDKQRLESLLYNLLSNALKFTRDKGTISLAVATREDEGHVEIVVQDNGIGIPKERLDSIFDRFAQYASAVRGDTGGSGIGLSLSKEIVELHKGSIKVDSKVGSGTTFTIHLPLGNSHFAMNQIDFAEGEQSDGEGTSAIVSSHRHDVCPPEGAQKILLVEDNSEMRAFIYNNLIDTYIVVEVGDGVDALEKIATEHPDIVITDLMMPRMDGIELVNRIRKDFEMSHIPVIMLTAKQTPEDRILAMKYGADAYITKPFSMELLLARIDNLLTQRRMLFEKISKSSARNRIVEIKPKDVVVTNKDEEFLQQMMAWIEENIENSELTIDDMASHMGLGRTTMYNKIKSLTSKSPVELIKEYRVTKSEMLLRTGQFSVSEVAYKVGFSDPGYFSRCFKEQYKCSPMEWLKKHKVRVDNGEWKIEN